MSAGKAVRRHLASGLALSVTLGGECGSGTWFPDVFAVCLKSLHGKEWQEHENFLPSVLQDEVSQLPHGSAGTSGHGVTGLPPPMGCTAQEETLQLRTSTVRIGTIPSAILSPILPLLRGCAVPGPSAQESPKSM